MTTMTLRKSTLVLAFGALLAATALGSVPARAQGDGGDAGQDLADARQFNNARAFSTSTTYYSAPAYVVPAPAYVVPTIPAQTATTYTTVSPGGTTTTTTYTNPGIAYLPPPVPAYSATTVVTQRPCNPWDVPRAGVTTACPY